MISQYDETSSKIFKYNRNIRKSKIEINDFLGLWKRKSKELRRTYLNSMKISI